MSGDVQKEIHRRIFELTLALYRVTDFFPKQEALRKHLREKGNEIFSRVTEYGFAQNPTHEAAGIIARIGALKGYLEIARSLRFVRSINIAVLEREYDFLNTVFAGELDLNGNGGNSGREKAEAKEAVRVVHEEAIGTWEDLAEMPLAAGSGAIRNGNGGNHGPDGLNERQKIILARLKEKQQARVGDLQMFFAGISAKTIQRDLQDLVTKNKLKKEGDKRWTIYSIMENVR